MRRIRGRSAGLTDKELLMIDSLGLEGTADPVTIDVRTDGHVPAASVAYARRRLEPLMRRGSRPVLFARVRLAWATDPARSQPASARVEMDIDGDVLHAHADAASADAAIDLVHDRMLDLLGHKRSRRQAQRRQGLPIGPDVVPGGGAPPPSED